MCKAGVGQADGRGRRVKLLSRDRSKAWQCPFETQADA